MAAERAVKFVLEDDIREARLLDANLNRGAVVQLAESTYGFHPNSLLIKFVDAEGDLVTVTSDEKFRKLVDAQAAKPFLRLIVKRSSSPATAAASAQSLTLHGASISSNIVAANNPGPRPRRVLDLTLPEVSGPRLLLRPLYDDAPDSSGHFYEEMVERFHQVPTCGVPSFCLRVLIKHSYFTLRSGTCCICQEQFSAGSKMALLPCCDQEIHLGCMERCFQNFRHCPLCRSALDSEVLLRHLEPYLEEMATLANQLFQADQAGRAADRAALEKDVDESLEKDQTKNNS